MRTKRDTLRPAHLRLCSALLLLSLLLLRSDGFARAADDGNASIVGATSSQENPLPPVDVVFCLVADNFPAIYPAPMIAVLAHRIIVNNPGHQVRFGIVTYHRFDPDLQLDLTEDQNQFLSVLSRWHTGSQENLQPIGAQLKSAMDQLSWSKDPTSLRKLYIVASGANDTANMRPDATIGLPTPDNSGWSSYGLNAGVTGGGASGTRLSNIFQTLKETGSTIPTAPGLDASVTEYTSFVSEFVSSLPQHRATVSMVYLGDPLFPMGMVDQNGIDTGTVAAWFDTGWPFREGWIEDAERGGGEFVQYIMPFEGSGSPLSITRAILWSHPEDFRLACRYLSDIMQVRYSTDKAQQMILQKKAAKAGFTGRALRDSVSPVIQFFKENPQLHGIILPSGD